MIFDTLSITCFLFRFASRPKLWTRVDLDAKFLALTSTSCRRSENVTLVLLSSEVTVYSGRGRSPWAKHGAQWKI